MHAISFSYIILMVNIQGVLFHDSGKLLSFIRHNLSLSSKADNSETSSSSSAETFKNTYAKEKRPEPAFITQNLVQVLRSEISKQPSLATDHLK